MDESSTHTEREKRRKKRLMVGIVVIVAILAIVAIVALLPDGPLGSDLTPEELAKKHIDDSIDAIGETIAGFILLPAPELVKELGGEYIEDRIHEVIKWRYSDARSMGGSTYEVTATAVVGFDVEVALATGRIEASVPFKIMVDEDSQTVRSTTPDFADADLTFNFPGLDEAVEIVEKAADDVTDQATEAVDEAKQKVADIATSLDTEDCIGSARDAGVPDRVLSLLEKPSDERNSIERSLVSKALDVAGLSDMCADLTE